MTLHSTFSKKEYEKERHVVIEENIRKEDDVGYFFEKQLNKIAYGGSSYQYPVDDRSYHHPYIKYEDLYDWYRTFYHPSNMCLSIVSNLSFTSIIRYIIKTDFIKKIKRVETRFSGLHPIVKVYAINPHPEKLRYLFTYEKKIVTNIVLIGFRTCPYHSPDKYILQVLAQILNGFSGKLFTILRSERGLTYNSSASTEYYSHTGFFSIMTKTDPKKLIYGATHSHPGVVPTLINLLIDLKKHGVSQADLNVAKGSIKGGLLLSMESINLLTQYNGNASILNNYEEVVPYQRLWDVYLSKVTKKDMDRVIRTYFCRENMVIGIVHGKDFDKSLVENICERFE
jgi:predicted Zn-dependent peptidase